MVNGHRLRICVHAPRSRAVMRARTHYTRGNARLPDLNADIIHVWGQAGADGGCIFNYRRSRSDYRRLARPRKFPAESEQDDLRGQPLVEPFERSSMVTSLAIAIVPRIRTTPCILVPIRLPGLEYSPLRPVVSENFANKEARISRKLQIDDGDIARYW